MKHTLALFIALICFVPAFALWHIDEDFDDISTLPQGWLTHDDGDGMIWRNLNNASHAHSGSRAAFCDNYFPNQNADWLITPQLSIAAGDSLVFYTRSWVSTENLKVYVSTTGTALDNFSQMILNLQDIGTNYQNVSLDLSAYANQNIYIGFLWNCENYGILIDDIKIGQPTQVVAELVLPDSISFIQGETRSVDFSSYVTTTDINNVTLSWQTPEHINVSASGLLVSFSSPDWAGEEELTFSIEDPFTDLTASDSILILVNPIPLVDLALTQVLSPHLVEYQGSAFIPKVSLRNDGLNTWDSQIQVWFACLNASGSEIYRDSAQYAGTLQPTQDAQVLFLSFTLYEEGSYSASFWLDEADSNPSNDSISSAFDIVLRTNVGGPDSFGYRYIDSTAPGGPQFDWIDISQTGTSCIMFGVNSWAGDDNFSEPIPLGFDFPFYGSSYSNAHVDVNGEILLAPNTWYNPYPDYGWDGDGNMFNYMYPIPGYTRMPGLIAVYWDDLLAIQGTGDVYFQSFGVAPHRYTVIQWHQIQFYAGSGIDSLLDFEVILHENGEIVMQYNSTATGQTGANVPHDNGRSSTVAIQNDSANAGICYLREIVQNGNYLGVEPSGNLLFDGLAIRFYSGDDNQAPIITHEPIGNTFNLSPNLYARVVDLSALQSVKLYYQTDDTQGSIDGVDTGHGNHLFAFGNLLQGQQVNYFFEAIDIHGNSSTLPASPDIDTFGFKLLPSANVNVLVAYSGSQDYQRVELPVYEARLSELDIAYDVYDWEEYDDYDFPQVYDTILAYANTGSQSPKALIFAQKLMDYLDSGSEARRKNLFFASDGLAFSQGGTPNSNEIKQLFSAYFRSYYVPTGLGGGTNGLAGPDVLQYHSGTILCRNNSPIGTPGIEYNVYANSPDCIFSYDQVPDWYQDMVPYPEIGATNAFTFAQGPIDGLSYLHNGVCATSVDVPNYRTFYLSFDFSQINNLNQNRELFSDLMDWFEISPSSIDESLTNGVKNYLGNSYPNPFNPTTTIEFFTQEPGVANLCIYNLKGQKVKTLVDDHLASGIHKVEWNGTDDHGKAVGSGIYMMRMQTGSFSASKKITLIK